MKSLWSDVSKGVCWFVPPKFWSDILFLRGEQELEKLMSYSGTPTVVWRRTGEICLVAPEFCMLTEWPLEELVGNGQKKYIYEVRPGAFRPRLDF